MTQKISESVYSSLSRAGIHTSTFGENSLAMRAVLATLDVLEGEGIVQGSIARGDEFRRNLKEALAPYEMFKAVRGFGMFTGIEWREPQKLLLRMPFEAFKRIHPAMFGQVLVMRMFRDKGIIAQICGNEFMVLKAVPPLVTTKEQLDHYVRSIAEVAHEAHTSEGFWAEAIGMMRRTLNV